MSDQRFPGPRVHTALNGRVSWNCVPLHSVAGRAVQDDGLRDELAERLTRISDEGHGEWHDRVLPNGAGDSWACVPIGRVIEVADEVLVGRAVQDDGLPTDPLATPTRHDWRLVLWQAHGHQWLYGDDGEMQCNQYPPADFRRDHIDDLLAHMDWSLQLGAAPPLHDPVPGLPTVEALAEAVHRVICPFHRPGPSHMDHGPDHFDDEHATAILTRLRAAPPLHDDPSGDESDER